jgi:hypothetical protein
MDNTVPRFLERHFPERVPPNARKLGATKKCVVYIKKKKPLGRRQGFGVLNVRPVCVLGAALRPTTPSSGKIIIRSRMGRKVLSTSRRKISPSVP